MMSVYDCLIAPIMTEKSANSKSDGVFKIAAAATKSDVKKAIEKIFGVQVAKVNILNRKGKSKFFRGKAGHTDGRKIAIVRLKEGAINLEGGF